MKLAIKDFHGLVTDGDTSDLQARYPRVLKNFDIDKSTLKLIVRRPYRAYKKLSLNKNTDNQLPTVVDYYPYWFLKYDIGTSVIYRNTMIIYRHKTSGVDWKIYSNGPTGGDGNAFIEIASESNTTHCYPTAVAGKVRISLGNATHYKIFMPFDWASRFPDSLSTYLHDKADLKSDIEASQDGKAFEAGDIIGGVTISNSYIYIDGRPYTDYATMNYKTPGDLVVKKYDPLPNPKLSVLKKGVYDCMVAPIFDSMPEQYGAAIFYKRTSIVNDESRVPLPANLPLVQDAYYKVNRLRGYYWSIEYFREGINTGYRWTLLESLYTIAFRVKYQANYYYGENGTELFKADLVSDPNIDVEITLDGGVSWSSVGVTLSNNIPTSGLGATNYGDGSNEVFPCYPTQEITNPGDWYNDATYGQLHEPWVPESIRPYFNKTAATTWTLPWRVPIVEPSEMVSGDVLDLSVVLPKVRINPRIKFFGVFMRKVVDVIDQDYALIHKVPVYDSDDPYFDGKNFWGDLGASPYADTIGFSIIIDNTAFENNKGFWSALYSTGDGGFRPYGHLESDITRKMGVMINRKARMYCGLIDDDEGQELVGYTPVTGGHEQYDIWFRPLLISKGSGEANTWLVEWQDRLLMFQKNNLWYAGLDDKNDRFFYLFHSTGFGVGTHIIKSIAKSRQALFFFNYDGVFKFDGSFPMDITMQKINEYWRYSISKVQKDLAVAGFNNKTNEYWIAIPQSVDTGGIDLANLNETPLGDLAPDPFNNWATAMNALPNTSKYIILIWDDDPQDGHFWRMYETYFVEDGETLPTRDDRPTFFFSDRENDWVFGTLDNNLYFWPGQESDIGTLGDGEGDGTAVPIRFEYASQFFGERSNDIIPNKIQIIGEQTPDNDLTVRINRDGYESDTDQRETLTIKKENRKPRLLRRRRSTNVQIAVTGKYETHTVNSVLTPLGDRVEIREIAFDYLPDLKRT